MPETDIGNTAVDTGAVPDDFSVPSETTDAAMDRKETFWTSVTWNDNLGYYKNIPEFQTSVDTKARWVVGGGYTADEMTTLLLGTIKGNGKDSFNSILKNAVVVKTVDGDSYAHVIRNDDGFLINLKPLAPSGMRSVWGGDGRIKRYEQITNFEGKIKVTKRFRPDEIFHLMRNRIADEIHGTSVVPAVQWIIDARQEAMHDWRKVMHRNIMPLIIWHLDTDDTAKISAFKTQKEAASKDALNIYIPKGTVVPEVVATAQNATLSALPWIDRLNDYFFQVVNTPQIVVGNAKEFTDASGKIVYLSYEQTVKDDQLYIEEQVLLQLNLAIKLTFPASLQNDAVNDTPAMELEEEPQEGAAQPNNTKTEVEGKT